MCCWALCVLFVLECCLLVSLKLHHTSEKQQHTTTAVGCCVKVPDATHSMEWVDNRQEQAHRTRTSSAFGGFFDHGCRELEPRNRLERCTRVFGGGLRPSTGGNSVVFSFGQKLPIQGQPGVQPWPPYQNECLGPYCNIRKSIYNTCWSSSGVYHTSRIEKPYCLFRDQTTTHQRHYLFWFCLLVPVGYPLTPCYVLLLIVLDVWCSFSIWETKGNTPKQTERTTPNNTQLTYHTFPKKTQTLESHGTCHNLKCVCYHTPQHVMTS